MKIEYDKYKTENDALIKKNKDLEAENEKVNTEIQLTIQKIDINALLKNIDIEDMRIIAQNNKQMSSVLNQLIHKWE